MRVRQIRTASVVAVAIGGLVVGLSLPAAAREAKHMINGDSIKKESIPANRLEEHSIGGKQMQPLKWHKLTPKNGWTGADDGLEGAPAWAIDAQGLVHLKGSLDGSASTSDVALTTPKPAKPKHELFLAMDTSLGTTGRLDIKPDGTVEVADDFDEPGSSTDFTSLEGVTYWPGK
jgi:hypothetical protein